MNLGKDDRRVPRIDANARVFEFVSEKKIYLSI
jgi:hypothetical protein